MFIFNKKKNYFKRKLDGVQKMIWDFEFKRFKTLEIREEMRAEFENAKSRLAVLEAKIKSEKENPTMEAGDIARLDDEKIRLDKEIEGHKEGMRALDLEVDGSRKTNEFPEGYTGITQQLDGLRELQGMLRSYIKEAA